MGHLDLLKGGRMPREWLFLIVWKFSLNFEETLGKVEGAGMAAQHLHTSSASVLAQPHRLPLVTAFSSDSVLVYHHSWTAILSLYAN